MTRFGQTAGDDIRIAADRLEARVRALFVALGCAEEAAQTIAEHLVAANLRGHDSHGVSLIPLYVRMVEEGKVDPGRQIAIHRLGPSLLAADAGRAFGQVAAKQAIGAAIAAAQETGLALLALRDSHHVGRIGHWAEQCAAAGLASIHFVNVVHSPPVVAPWGGAAARLHTNPFCIGVPRGTEPPLILDFATSRAAQGKFRILLARGEPAPEGYLIDSEGRPTTDPVAAYGSDDIPAGALLPFGEHKGFGLGLMCEILAGAVGGGRSISPETMVDGIYVNNMLSICFDMDRLSAPDRRDHDIDALVAYVRGCAATADGPVRLPGEGGRARRSARLADGIPVDRTTWALLSEHFDRYGV